MSHLQGGISRKSTITDLEIINQKRTALQKLVKLTSMLHQLHQGLQSVILMGKTAAQIPDKIVEKFKALSASLKEKPTKMLENTLSTTDVKIDRDIKHVLEISQKSNELLEQELGAMGTKLSDALKDDYHEFVGDFKKKSQASITLRITLKTRNVLVKSFNLPVPETFIKNQIMALDVKEQKCRAIIKKDMGGLQTDVDVMLKDKGCSKEVVDVLEKIKTELEENSKHFAAGKPIEDMPIIYENIELSGAPQVVDEIEAVINPVEKNKTEVEDEVVEAEHKKLGFFSHFVKWLKAPINKSWKDTE
ncbi:hypothetical protein MNBD_GAMMA08-3047 [hydrothermal vent metagenome]|uniref:Uncharacterized protein n=1 Tax=hydrothermal vent metagenome TaxID=652676 RepID=A0A3B0XH57_9ZZZZ